MTITEEIYALLKSKLTNQDIVNCTRIDPKYIAAARRNPNIIYKFPLRVDIALSHAWELFEFSDHAKNFSLLFQASYRHNNGTERQISHLIDNCLRRKLNVTVWVSWHKSN